MLSYRVLVCLAHFGVVLVWPTASMGLVPKMSNHDHDILDLHLHYVIAAKDRFEQGTRVSIIRQQMSTSRGKAELCLYKCSKQIMIFQHYT